MAWRFAACMRDHSQCPKAVRITPTVVDTPEPVPGTCGFGSCNCFLWYRSSLSERLNVSPPASSSTSYSLRRIVLLPTVSVALRAALTMSQSSPLYSSRLPRHHTRRVFLAIVLAAGILIDIVLVTSYCTPSHCLCRSESCANHVTKLTIILVASYSPSYSSRLTRQHTRRYRPRRHPPHRRRTRHVVLYNFPMSLSL
jgi:hypothetical protein